MAVDSDFDKIIDEAEREFIRLWQAGPSLGGAHKGVEHLEAAGLVTSTVAGRNRLIEADRSSPVYVDIRGLLLKTLGPEPLICTALANVDGIQEAFNVGSWADRAERSPADIDVLVVGDPDIGKVYDAAAVETEVGRPINVTVRSPSEWAEADGALDRVSQVRRTDRSAMRILDDLRVQGLIEAVEPDQATATQWLDDAGRHLESATKIAETRRAPTYSHTTRPEGR